MPDESGMDGGGFDKTKPIGPPRPITTNSESLPGPTKEKLPKPHFKFILGHHGNKEDAELMIGAFKDCDVIAMENIGGTPKERINGQALWQVLADEPKDSPGTIYALNNYKENMEKGVEGAEFSYYLAQGLAGSGKKIFLIDIPETDPNYQLMEKGEVARTEYYDALHQKQDLQTILPKLRKYVDIWAKSITEREALVVDQLKELSASFFEGKEDIRIGVLEGVAHTYPSQEIHQAGFPTERVFFQGDGLGYKGIGQRLYNWQEDAIRKKRFQPEKNLSEDFLKRVVVRDLHSLKTDYENELRRLDLELEKMPEHEVDAMLSELLAKPAEPSPEQNT